MLYAADSPSAAITRAAFSEVARPMTRPPVSSAHSWANTETVWVLPVPGRGRQDRDRAVRGQHLDHGLGLALVQVEPSHRLPGLRLGDHDGPLAPGQLHDPRLEVELAGGRVPGFVRRPVDARPVLPYPQR